MKLHRPEGDLETSTTQPRETGAVAPTPATAPRTGLRRLLVPAVAVVSLVVVALTLVLPRRALELGDAIQTVLARLEQKKQKVAARDLSEACRRDDCGCVDRLVRRGLEVGETALVERLLVAAARCADEIPLAGLRAELLVRSGQDAQGRSAAARVLQETPDEPHALYALALADYRQQALVAAKDAAERALRAGRGNTAAFLLGRVNASRGDFAGAKAAFESIVKTEPEDVDARHQLGLVARGSAKD